MSEVKDAYVAMGGVMSIPISDKIHDALVRFQHQPITPTELARFVDMNDAEIETMRLYWNPVFNKSDIYLSPEVICDHLGYSKPSNFYKSTVFKKYVVDGLVTGANIGHPLIVAYKSQCSGPSIENKNHTGGKEPNYYICSGDTFKRLALAAGTDKSQQIHGYFIKVEALCQLMIEYITALRAYKYGMLEQQMAKQLTENDETKLAHAAEKKRADNAETAQQVAESIAKKNADDLAEERKKLSKADVRNAVLQRFDPHAHHRATDGWFYLLTTDLDASINHFKAGSTVGLATRLRQYHTWRNPLTDAYFCYYVQMHRPTIMEDLVKIALREYQFDYDDRSFPDEGYFVRWDVLMRIVADCYARYMSIINDANQLMDSFESNLMGTSSITPARLDLPITQEPEEDAKVDDVIIFSILGLNETEADSMAIKIINAFMRKCGHTYDITTDFSNTAIPTITVYRFELMEFAHEHMCHGQKGTFDNKATKWKNRIDTKFVTAVNITYVKRAKK